MQLLGEQFPACGSTRGPYVTNWALIFPFIFVVHLRCHILRNEIFFNKIQELSIVKNNFLWISWYQITHACQHTLHLSDAFIQSDLLYVCMYIMKCIQVIIFFYQYVCFLGIEPTTFALLTQCSNHWATETRYNYLYIHLKVIYICT